MTLGDKDTLGKNHYYQLMRKTRNLKKVNTIILKICRRSKM